MGINKALRNKVFESAGYVLFLRVLDKFSSIFTIIILARLLDPGDFGLMSLAMIVVTLVQSLSSISLEAAIVQKAEVSNSDLNVAWTFSRLIKSLIIIIIVFFSAPFIGEFFNEPDLTLILQVMMIAHIFIAFENIGMIIYTKELNFQKVFYVGIISRFIRIFVFIISAYYLRSVWAFVFAYISLYFSTFVLSYFFHPYRPKLEFDLKVFKSLFNFGGWIFASQIIRALFDTIDRAAVGRLMDATFLGFYHISHRLGNEMPNELKSVFNTTFFPLFSIQQDNLERSKKNFLKTLKLTSFIIFPIISIMFLLSDFLVILLLSNKWNQAIDPLKILLVAALMRSLVFTTFPLFKGLGFPKYETYLIGISVIFISIFIFPLVSNYGIEGAAFTILIGHLAIVPVAFFFLKKIISIEINDIFFALFKPALVSIVGGLLIYGMNLFNSFNISWIHLFQILLVSFSYFVFVYFVFLKMIKDQEIISVHNLLIAYLQKKKLS
tara:strand:- start:2000 stop:3484 length:1485 start_codon:yes stop_codon:yes gene_type:complete